MANLKWFKGKWGTLYLKRSADGKGIATARGDVGDFGDDWDWTAYMDEKLESEVIEEGSCSTKREAKEACRAAVEKYDAARALPKSAFGEWKDLYDRGELWLIPPNAANVNDSTDALAFVDKPGVNVHWQIYDSGAPLAGPIAKDMATTQAFAMAEAEAALVAFTSKPRAPTDWRSMLERVRGYVYEEATREVDKPADDDTNADAWRLYAAELSEITALKDVLREIDEAVKEASNG